MMASKKLPLRLGVGAVVLNKKNQVFVGKRKDNPIDKWQMPQGGVNTGENLIGLLERRLDAIVYRAKFVPTVFSARQFINHGHVKVNGRRVNIPSYRVKTTDIIEIKDKSKGLEVVLRGTESSERDIPDYIEVDGKKMTAKITRIPNLSEVPYPVQMEPNLVVEFYSRN